MRLFNWMKPKDQIDPVALSHLRNMYEMAMADGHLDEDELSLLKKTAVEHKLNESAVEDIRSNPNRYEFNLPISDEDRIYQFYEIVQMMVADGYIDVNEMKLCMLFARKFGFDPFKADELVDILVQEIRAGNPYLATRKKMDALID
jgi:uncharacterized tellurite resistance protein B-like protein